ncbi:MAG: hypothetical protein R3F44_01270 [Candidatus Competibacteraceae bacterium]
MVIAGPQTPLRTEEFGSSWNTGRGGHLLWLLEPGDPSGLQELATLLGITVLPGVVVDADTPLLGINPCFHSHRRLWSASHHRVLAFARPVTASRRSRPTACRWLES